MTASHAPATGASTDRRPVTYFGPDFPFAYDDWITHPKGLGALPAELLGTEVAIVGSGAAGMIAAYELMRLGLKPVVYEAGRLGGRLRSQPFEGAEGVIAELGGDALSDLLQRLLPLPRACRARDGAVPEPARPGDAQHGDRPRRPVDLCRAARSAAAAVPGGGRRLARGARGGRELQRHPGCHPCPRHCAAQVAVERAGAGLGRSQLLRFRRHQPRLRQPLVSPSRGVRPGRLRHRRLGHGLPQLDAGDPARRRDRLRRGPAPRRRRRRAAAAPAVAP